jgi:hypothetical protein
MLTSRKSVSKPSESAERLLKQALLNYDGYDVPEACRFTKVMLNTATQGAET